MNDNNTNSCSAFHKPDYLVLRCRYIYQWYCMCVSNDGIGRGPLTRSDPVAMLSKTIIPSTFFA